MEGSLWGRVGFSCHEEMEKCVWVKTNTNEDKWTVKEEKLVENGEKGWVRSGYNSLPQTLDDTWLKIPPCSGPCLAYLSHSCPNPQETVAFPGRYIQTQLLPSPSASWSCLPVSSLYLSPLGLCSHSCPPDASLQGIHTSLLNDLVAPRSKPWGLWGKGLSQASPLGLSTTVFMFTWRSPCVANLMLH